MGEDLSTGAKIGITLIILCSLLAIVLALLMMMKNITNQGASTLQSGLDQMLATRFDDYDQQNVSGTQVSAAIKLFEGQPVAMVVKTSACQESGSSAKGGYNYGAILEGYTKATGGSDGDVFTMATDITTKKTAGDTFYTINLNTSTNAVQYNMNVRPMTRSGSEPFVRSSAKFLAELIKDSTGTTVGVCFTQIT